MFAVFAEDNRLFGYLVIWLFWGGERVQGRGQEDAARGFVFRPSGQILRSKNDFSVKLLEEYRQLKIQVPDCLLLMQVGAFMQVLEEDAPQSFSSDGLETENRRGDC